MNTNHVRTFAALVTGAAMVLGAWNLMDTAAVKAQTAPAYDAAAVKKGLDIAPVPLDLTGKDRNQVGYGSYLVNAVSGCNDCHTNPAYKAGGDPFRGQTKTIDKATYLAGGVVFGPFTSRNITPNAQGPTTGSLANFKLTMRTGVDLRKLHPQLGPVLQVMPWPVYQDMNDLELEAIYAYLSAIPCLEGGPEEKPNRCTPAAPTMAVASPKNVTTEAFQIGLDGSRSKASDGGKLTYSWATAKGSPVATILFGDTDKPVVQFGTRGPIDYNIELTVTDSKGTKATDTVTVKYVGR
jgi:hypothetical protein